MRWPILIVLFAVSASGQELESAWEGGRYREILAAIDARIAATGEAEAALLHDRGNCLFRLGRYAEAALAYRRSLRRSGSNAETAFNLELCERRLGIIREDPGFVERLLEAFAAVDDSRALILLILVECGALLLLVLGRRRPGLVLTSLLLLTLVVAGAWCLRDEGLRRSGSEALVLREGALLRSEPRPAIEAAIEMQPGELLRVEARSDRWLRVRRGEARGYVAIDDVGLID